MQSEALDPTSSGPASWFHHLSISNPSCPPPSPRSSWQSILEVLKLLLPKCFHPSMITYVTQDPKCFSRHSNTLVAFLSLPEGLGSWAQIGWSWAPTMDGPNPGHQGRNWGLASQTLHQLASTHLTLLALHTSNLLSPFPAPNATSELQTWLNSLSFSKPLPGSHRKGTQSGNPNPVMLQDRQTTSGLLPVSEWAKRCAQSLPGTISF